MSATPKQRRLPRHATLHSQLEIDVAAEATRAGFYSLLPGEELWRDRQQFLQKHGYILRRRYSPDWEPSWMGTNLQPIFCEDSIMLLVNQVIDAKRAEDGHAVAIKAVRNESQELQIMNFLSADREAREFCIHILQVLPDPLDSKISLVIMPFLRPCNDPEFYMLGEAVDFVEQSLQGLAFLHRHRIAHRDVAAANIMMDARALFPEGYHPVLRNYTPDALYKVTPLTRTGRGVRYFYIDFGLSVKLAEGASPLVVGDVGRDDTVPELSSHIPYDAFKADVHSLGTVYSTEFEEKYHGFDFLIPMISWMKHPRPEMRPPMDDILAQWREIKSSIDPSQNRWRLSPKSELAIERVFNDTVAAAWEGIYQLKKFVK